LCQSIKENKLPQKIVIDTVALEQQWASGVPAAQLAKVYNCSASQLYKVRKKHNLRVKLKNTSVEPGAPSRLDERLSKESLQYSPWVLARIAELRGIR
jgi:hypothetical protein